MRVGTSEYPEWAETHEEDHPHACGDKELFNAKSASIAGSSPCVWGQVKNSFAIAPLSRIIPMRVGTSTCRVEHIQK